MRPGRASFTAQIVSFARGLATLSSPAQARFDDSLARVLLPPPLSTALAAASLSPTAARVMRGIVDAGTGHFIEHMALRTLAIDEAVCDAVAGGAHQLVLLGAGLDARAHRLAALRDVTVFEVDHPDTQREKQRRIRGHEPSARELRYVAVDFAHDSLDEALTRAGHDASALTCWVWEGVTMYLPPTAMRASLAALSARSTPGSRLAVTYIDRRAFDAPFARQLTHAVFRGIGESLLGMYSSDELARVLGEADFALRSDSGSADWRATYGARQPRLRVFDGERLAVAERR